MEINVCIGEYCHLHGAEIVVKTIRALLDERNSQDAIGLKGCFCMRKCKEEGVSVQIDGTIHKVNAEEAEDFFAGVMAPN